MMCPTHKPITWGMHSNNNNKITNRTSSEVGLAWHTSRLSVDWARVEEVCGKGGAGGEGCSAEVASVILCGRPIPSIYDVQLSPNNDGAEAHEDDSIGVYRIRKWRCVSCAHVIFTCFFAFCAQEITAWIVCQE